LDQPIDRPPAQLPPLLSQGRDDAEPQEEQEEKNLADASGGDNSHGCDLISIFGF
jgi:hypothetical protein